MPHRYFLKIFLLFCIKINLTLSQNSTEKIETEKVLKINKCSTSNIFGGSIKLPNHFLKQSTKRETNTSAEDELEIKVIQSTKDLDCSNPLLVLDVALNPNPNETDSGPYFLSNGYMKYNQTNFSPDEFCFESKSESNLQLKICMDKPVCSSNSPCIQKCCEIDEVLDLTQFVSDGRLGCRRVEAQKTWKPSLYYDPYTKILSTSISAVKINYIPHHPKSFCEDGLLLMSLRSFDEYETVTPFRILADGAVTEKVGRTGWTLVDSYSSCVDGAQNFPLKSINSDSSLSRLSGPYTGDEKDTVVIDCRSFVFSERDVENEKFTGVYVLALVIATVFLLLTLLAHILLWKRQAIRGWTLMCYVTFLAAEFILLIIARLINERGAACSMTGIGVHFTALATFSWLTAMNFDVFYSFRTMNPCTTRKEQFKLFLFYAVFATAIPVCIVTLGLILENVYEADAFSEVIVPEYGKTRCGLGESAEFPYLFGPISLLLTTNLIFLVVTLYYVYKHQKILMSNGIKTKILKDKIRFFGMLFLIAGVTWIMDILSWATTPTHATTPWYWMLFDFVNIFQAIAIFLIFVCNPTTLHYLQKELPCLSKLKLWPKTTTADANLPTQPECFEQNRKLSITQIFSVTDNGKAHLELNTLRL